MDLEFGDVSELKCTARNHIRDQVELGNKVWKVWLMFRKLGKVQYIRLRRYLCLYCDNDYFYFVEPELLLIINLSSGLVALIAHMSNRTGKVVGTDKLYLS